MSIELTLDFSKGSYTRTRYNNSKIELLPNTVVTSFLGEASEWIESGGGTWQINGDKVVINNTIPGSSYKQLTHNLQQDTNTICPIMFRVKATGENIAGSNSYTDWGLRMRITYSDAGLGSGVYDEVGTIFPTGTWDEQQFSLTFTPTQPIRYIYCYIFTRNYSGKITMWDAEVIPLNSSNVNYGIWESEFIDLYKINNKPVNESKIKLDRVAFKYGNIDNVNNFYSAEYSKKYLSDFTYLVVEDPTRLTQRELEITDYLKTLGVKIFGYTYIGWSDSIIALTDIQIKSHIDDMAAQGWYGVFLDMSGFDYGVTRDSLNIYVNYAHSKGLKAFVNAWTIPDILGNDVNTNLNSLGQAYNPNGTPTSLGKDDWILLESFFSRGDDLYAGEKTGGWQKYIGGYITAVSLAKPLGVKVAALADKFTFRSASDIGDLTHSYNLALICGVDAWSYGTTDFTDSNYPVVKYGNSFKGDVKQVNGSRWERETDRATIWFEGNGSVVSSGSFSTVDYLSTKKPSLTKAQFDNVGRVTHTWLTSSDKVNWIEWKDDDTSKRYVKVKAELVK